MTSLALRTEPRAKEARCTSDERIVTLTDGRILSVPRAWFPRLANGTPDQRADIQLLGDGQGLHWPSLDEDLSVLGLLAGRPSLEVRQKRIA